MSRGENPPARTKVSRPTTRHVLDTDASGNATFSLDDGTWTVAITLPFYTFTQTTLVVDGNKTPTYSMTAQSITASEAGLTTGYWTVYNEEGVTLGLDLATVYMRIYDGPDTDGLAYDGGWREANTDANGLVQFTNLIKGGSYKVKLGPNAEEFEIAVSASAGASIALGELIGRSDGVLVES